MGASDGWDNEWMFANIADPYSEDTALANDRRHQWALLARVGIVLSVGTTALTPPDGWDHAAARMALYSSSLLTAHHVAHNIQQGQPLTYSFGCYACEISGEPNRTGAVLLSSAVGAVFSSAYLTRTDAPLSRESIGRALYVQGLTTTLTGGALFLTEQTDLYGAFQTVGLGIITSIAGGFISGEINL